MDVTQKAREVVSSAVGAASRVLPGNRGGAGAARQTLTISRSAEDVLAAWRDPLVVSRLLGDLGRAEADGERWTFTLTAGQGATVEAEPVSTTAGVEFRRPGPGAGQGQARDAEDDTEGGRTGPEGSGGAVLLRVGTRPAPRDLGTEVTCEVAPEFSAGVGAVPFTLLYRLRALLLTGEIPTLRPNPSAREEER
ncbi:hypothetical protein MN205_15810 [Kineococcus sp. TRM81007]|uniref:hypothetical protein n=1 Tax=Kineococcus sp. TRM81007 TaxID=2925831 RepID=UPI001F56AD2C|nr:hypothetical protein [Kineococcus sp. TRM81007]MCI2239940.1 hypothetical protein [Kineococcus sp. TRM81007]